MKKKDILFLCQYFYPEVNSSATLPFDTAKSLVKGGRTVDVLCGWPKEYSQEKTPPNFETVDGVNIHRLHYLQLSRISKMGRFINFISFTAAVLMHLGAFRHYSCVMVYSNPPILPAACVLANMLFRTPFVFVSYDVYPEIAVASGMISNHGSITYIMRCINQQVFRRAASVVALTDDMRDFLLAHRPEIDAERVAVIPNWAYEEEKESPVVSPVENILTVSYFGNLGVCQDTDTLLETMMILQNRKNIQFLIAAHGSKKMQIQQAVAGLDNVRFVDYLTGDDFTHAAAKCNCGIVSLKSGLSGMCAPSKYYSYLNSGQVVVAVLDEESSMSKEILTEQIGDVVFPGESERLAHILCELAENRSKTSQMGRHARELYERKYSRERAMRAYERLLSAIIDGQRNKRL